MEDRDYLILLYDYYGDLFNEKQREYFESYYFLNLSLSEIGNNLNISRNAVHKVIQGMEEKLYFYEKKLGMVQTNREICDIIKNENNIDKLKQQLERIVQGDEIRG